MSSAVDRSALRASLLAGDKLSVAAEKAGCAVPYASRITAGLGLARTWTTLEERQLLTALRSGRSVVVPVGEAPAGAALASRIASALAEFRSA